MIFIFKSFSICSTSVSIQRHYLNCFLEEIKEARQLVNPQLILGVDGSVDSCIVTGIITEEGENPHDEEVLARFKATGQKHVFILAQADSVHECRENVEILLESLNLPLLTQDYQLVMDMKMTNIILGLQTCTSMFGCPYCESMVEVSQTFT